jgi:hypothetical protein
MNMLFKPLSAGALVMALGAFIMTPTHVAAVTVVDNTIISTQSNTPWVTILPGGDEGIWHICAAAFWSDPGTYLTNASWTDCYNTFVAENLAAGNSMYQTDGQWRLFKTQTYIGPRPSGSTTAADTAVVVRLGDLLERATDGELMQLREAVQGAGGNIVDLVSRLDAFEERLDAVEEVNGVQTERLDDIDAFVDPLKAELGGRTLTEFVGDRSNPTIPWWTLVLALVLLFLLGLAIFLLIKLVIWVLLRAEPKPQEPEPLATQADLESLKGKVEDEATKTAELGERVDELALQTEDNQVVAGTALKLASPLKFTKTTDLGSLNHGLPSEWTATSTKTRKHYVIPFTKNEDGMIEVPILRRAGHPHYIQPFKFTSIEGTENMLCMAHASGRLEGCLKHKPKT